MLILTKLTRPKVSRKMNRILIAGAAGLALMVSGAAAGAAVLAGPIDDAGVIHGCYYPATATGSHRVVLQNAGTRCPSGTAAISWSSVAGYESVDTKPIFLGPGSPTKVASVNLLGGDFFMTATVDAQNPSATPEGVSCVLRDELGHEVASYTGSITLSSPVVSGEVTLTGFNTSGGTTTLSCKESSRGAIVVVTGAVLTAIPVTTVHRG